MLEAIFEDVARVVLEIFFGMTGHCALWAATLGRRRFSETSDETATVVGVLFWVVVAMVIWLAVR